MVAESAEPVGEPRRKTTFQSVNWISFITTSVVVAAGRALLMALRDDYVAAGLAGMAVRSIAENFLESLGIAAPFAAGVALLCATLRPRGSKRMWLLLPAALAAYLFIVGRTPKLPLHTFGFSTPAAKAGHVGGAAVAMAASVLLTSTSRSRLNRLISVVSLTMVLAAVAAQYLTLAPVSSWPGKPNVILISLDTLRAEHLGSYGYSKPTSPALDRFAATSTTFMQAFTVQPWTLTAHASMLTGLYPDVHGVRHGRALSPRVRTMAQAFRASGYTTAGVVDTVSWMDPRFGIDRGFHIYRTVRGSAANKNEHIFYLLDDLEERPFFLFLHYYDAHSDWHQLPYDSDDHDRDRFSGWYHGEFTGCGIDNTCATRFLQELNERREGLAEEELSYLKSLYDAGIRSMDRHLGRLFKALERRGLMKNSIVLLTSDHGEEFFEHGMALHYQAYDECLRVPLIVHVPGRRAGRVSDLFVSLVDIVPTLLDLAGIDAGVTNGVSFKRALVDGVDTAVREFILVKGDRSLGLRSLQSKFITRGDQVQLFDLISDPGEQANLAGAGLSARTEATWQERLRQENATATALITDLQIESVPFGSTGGGPPQQLSEEELEGLRALGYVSHSRDTASSSHRDSSPR